MKAVVKTLSLCKCGFHTLNDHVRLGDEYNADERSSVQGGLKCGGCGEFIPSELVWVDAKGDGAAGYLPKEIFQF
jgi:hypothetical protein